MNIGIDIDNTITDIQEKVDKAAYDYARRLGKHINESKSVLEEMNNNGDVYREKLGFTYEELKYFLKVIKEEITNIAKPRDYAVETIRKLRKEGNKIVIITARDSEFHDDPYALSKEWLDRNNIEYDKLIVNAREKGSVCKEEGIDLFIDDQLNNCLDVLKQGIKVIRMTDGNSRNSEIVDINDWNKIYEFIGGVK